MAGFWAGFGETFSTLYRDRKERSFRDQENEENRLFQSEEAAAAREFSAGEAEKQRQFEAGQNELTRAQQREQFLQNLNMERLSLLGTFGSKKGSAAAAVAEAKPALTWLDSRIGEDEEVLPEARQAYMDNVLANPANATAIKSRVEDYEEKTGKRVSGNDLMEIFQVVRSNNINVQQDNGVMEEIFSALIGGEQISDELLLEAMSSSGGGIVDSGAALDVRADSLVLPSDRSSALDLGQKNFEQIQPLIVRNINLAIRDLKEAQNPHWSAIQERMDGWDTKLQNMSPEAMELLEEFLPMTLYEGVKSGTITIDQIESNPFLLQNWQESMVSIHPDDAEALGLDATPRHLFDMKETINALPDDVLLMYKGQYIPAFQFKG